MFRGFRHKLLFLLQSAVLLSGLIAFVLWPGDWKAILVCVGGGSAATLICGRLARRYLNASIGRLRRVADDLGHGRPADMLEAHPGDDMYKLTTAINLLAARLAEASREEKRLHEELRRRERLAFLGELAASVAHEVNNPLDGIQNCTRILRRSLHDPDRTTQMLDLIESGLGRIELIVRRLLTLAREHVVRPTEARMQAVIEAAVSAATPKIESRSITLEQQCDINDDRIQADRALLEQVFVNLILNAADSMSDGGVLTITMRREPIPPEADRSDGATDFVCVDVADTGTGIADDVLPHIFEPFFTTKTGGKGTGLGLSIAARIVDAHQGLLDVRSQVGGGTTFTVRIPSLATSAGAELPVTEQARET